MIQFIPYKKNRVTILNWVYGTVIIGIIGSVLTGILVPSLRSWYLRPKLVIDLCQTTHSNEKYTRIYLVISNKGRSSSKGLKVIACVSSRGLTGGMYPWVVDFPDINPNDCLVYFMGHIDRDRPGIYLTNNEAYRITSEVHLKVTLSLLDVKTISKTWIISDYSSKNMRDLPPDGVLIDMPLF